MIWTAALLPKGSRAIVFYGAANRDPGQFPQPDRFDVRRDNAGRHMASSSDRTDTSA
jgi:cytochrome P450